MDSGSILHRMFAFVSLADVLYAAVGLFPDAPSGVEPAGCYQAVRRINRSTNVYLVDTLEGDYLDVDGPPWRFAAALLVLRREAPRPEVNRGQDVHPRGRRDANALASSSHGECASGDARVTAKAATHRNEQYLSFTLTPSENIPARLALSTQAGRAEIPRQGQL